MIKQTPKMFPCPCCGGASFVDTVGEKEFDFCRTEVRKFFDFPETVSYIQFTAYPRPGKNRIPIKCYLNNIIVKNEPVPFLQSIYQLLGKKKWYVKMHYWE